MIAVKICGITNDLDAKLAISMAQVRWALSSTKKVQDILISKKLR